MNVNVGGGMCVNVDYEGRRRGRQKKGKWG